VSCSSRFWSRWRSRLLPLPSATRAAALAIPLLLALSAPRRGLRRHSALWFPVSIVILHISENGVGLNGSTALVFSHPCPHPYVYPDPTPPCHPSAVAAAAPRPPPRPQPCPCSLRRAG
jgi:hypothetical protein